MGSYTILKPFSHFLSRFSTHFFKFLHRNQDFPTLFFKFLTQFFKFLTHYFKFLTHFFKFSTQKSSLPLTNLVIHTLIKFPNTTVKILRLYGPHKCFEPKCEIAFDHEGNVLFTVWCTHEYIKL